MSHKPFIEESVELADMTTAKSFPTPFPLSHPLYYAMEATPESELEHMYLIPFREVIGSLFYVATSTRPYIATAVSMIAKFQSDPFQRNWKSLKTVFSYLIGTPYYVILLPKVDGDVPQGAWCDADW